MKIQIKPTLALVPGLILLSGLLCQTTQADPTEMVETNTAVLADNLGANTGPEALTVGYSVTKDLLTDIYTYTYTVNNPAGDVILSGEDKGQSEVVALYSLAFNAATPGAVLGGVNGAGTFGVNNGSFGVEWFLIDNVVAGSSSAPLSFESDFGPVMGDAQATDANSPSPWSSSPFGNTLPVPQAVPDSTGTMTLLAGIMTLLPFGSSIKRIGRK